MKILSNSSQLSPLSEEFSLLRTPKPPYIAVISTNIHSGAEKAAYDEALQATSELAKDAPGFLGGESSVETMDDGRTLKIGILYFKDLESLNAWRNDPEHVKVKKLGKKLWYDEHNIRVCQVLSHYGSNLTQAKSTELAYQKEE